MKRFLSFLLCLTVLSGCSAQPPKAEPLQTQFFSMDTVMSLRIYDGGGEETLHAARREVERLDKLLSRTNGDSQISALNAHAGDGTMVRLEPEVAGLLSFAKSVSGLLPGAFDITIAPVMDAWGFTTEERRVPSAKTLAAAMALTDSAMLTVDEAASAARLEQAGMEVDLGAVAKGFTAARVETVLRELRSAGPGRQHHRPRQQGRRQPLAGGGQGPSGHRRSALRPLPVGPDRFHLRWLRALF